LHKNKHKPVQATAKAFQKTKTLKIFCRFAQSKSSQDPLPALRMATINSELAYNRKAPTW